MIKCVDNGRMTCISKAGTPKSRWDNADDAIYTAKIINNRNIDSNFKLVAYKCSHCNYYHLTSKPKRVRAWEK